MVFQLSPSLASSPFTWLPLSALLTVTSISLPCSALTTTGVAGLTSVPPAGSMVTETGLVSGSAPVPGESVPPEGEQAEISTIAASIPAVESNVFLGNM